jgi:hypothetical protein
MGLIEPLLASDSSMLVAVLTAATFVLSALLFLVTGAMRRRLDAVLQRSQLAVPERRWSYDQGYLIQFLNVLHAASQRSPERDDWLAYYRRRILVLDIIFAVIFAAFIALGSGLIAAHPARALWIPRAASTTAALGLLYGLSDVLEDITLKRMLRHAEREFELRSRDPSREEDVAVADAAQTDAANMLTRLKVITLTASVIGLAAFLLFLICNFLIGTMGGPRSTNRMTPQTAAR